MDGSQRRRGGGRGADSARGGGRGPEAGFPSTGGSSWREWRPGGSGRLEGGTREGTGGRTCLAYKSGEEKWRQLGQREGPHDSFFGGEAGRAEERRLKHMAGLKGLQG